MWQCKVIQEWKYICIKKQVSWKRQVQFKAKLKIARFVQKTLKRRKHAYLKNVCTIEWTDKYLLNIFFLLDAKWRKSPTLFWMKIPVWKSKYHSDCENYCGTRCLFVIHPSTLGFSIKTSILSFSIATLKDSRLKIALISADVSLL